MAERDPDDPRGPDTSQYRTNRIQGISNANKALSDRISAESRAASPMQPNLQDFQMGREAPGFFRGDDGQLRNSQGEVVTERRRPSVVPLDEYGNPVMPKSLDVVLQFLSGLRGVGTAGAAARGASAAKPAPQLPPSRRNAIFPDEMLNPPTAAPNTVRPTVPFRPNQFEDDIGEVARQRIANSRRPSTPDVNTSPFDNIGRFDGEGGLTRDAIEAARRMSQERIAAEEAFRARQLSTADSEGMMLRPSPGASRQAAQEAAYRAQIDDMINEGGGGAISRTPPPGTAFTMGEGSSSGVYRPNFTVPEGSRFGLPALRGSTEAVPTGAPASAFGAPASAAAGGLDTAALLRRLGIGLGGAGAGAMAIDVARDMYGQPTPLGSSSAPSSSGYSPFDETNIGAPNFTPGMFDETNIGAPNFTPGMFDETNISYKPAPRSSQQSSTTAPPAPAAPAAAASSLMGRLFGGPDYQSNSRVVVSRPEGASQKAVLNWADSDNSADFFRADRAMQELLKNKEEFVGKNNTDFGRLASGGSVDGSSSKASGSGRDAAIYKALEIIHHMMVNR